MGQLDPHFQLIVRIDFWNEYFSPFQGNDHSFCTNKQDFVSIEWHPLEWSSTCFVLTLPLQVGNLSPFVPQLSQPSTHCGSTFTPPILPLLPIVDDFILCLP